MMNEKRIERLNHVKVTEKEKDNLEGAKKEAEELIAKERTICEKKNELFQIFVKDANTNVDGVQEKHKQLQEKLDYEQEKLKKNEASLKTMEENYTKCSSAYDDVTEEVGGRTLQLNTNLSQYESLISTGRHFFLRWPSASGNSRRSRERTSSTART